MNYKVLYRKYRPNNFENIIGQEYIIKTLKNSVKNANVSHAYIFSGPRGTGKTSTAKVFAKSINCLSNIDGTPCNNCEFCTNFQENPDIIEIDAASNNGVDEIRNLIDNIKLTPTNGKYKVYIIDEVHMLTTSAFNALLLTLEEPPKHAIFILATTNIENVPITILSRCQRFDFQKIRVEDINKKLKEICNLEQIDIDDEALNEIAYISEGGMRDALSLLDQLSKDKEKINLNLIEKHIKLVSHKTISDIFDLIEDNNIEKFIEKVDEFRNSSTDYKTLIKRMVEFASNKAKNIKKSRKYYRLTFTDYKNIVLDLTECLTKININVDAFTIFEMILLEYFDANLSKSKILENNSSDIIENKANDLKIEEEVVHKNEINNDEFNELIKIRVNNCFVNVQKVFLENMKQQINQLRSSINVSGKIKSILLDTDLVAASDKYLIFSCDNINIMNMANKMHLEIEEILSTNNLNKYKIIFITKDMWNIEKQKYINNLKNNIKYNFIEEKDNNDEELVLSDVFDISKIEII